MVAVAVMRTDFTAATLRSAAICADDTQITRRALAIAMVLDGYPRATAAELAGMDRQTLRDWVHRFNAEGLEGLSDRPRDRVYEDYVAIVQACADAWNALMKLPKTIASIATRPRAQVKI